MNKKLVLFFLLLFGMLASGGTYAQKPSKRSNQTKEINEKEYYVHHVKWGETLYGLSLTYKVSVKIIEELNPKVKNGLKAEQVLIIPVHTPSNTNSGTNTNKKSEPPQEQPKVEPEPQPEVEIKSEGIVNEPFGKPIVEPAVDSVEKPKEEPKEEPKEQRPEEVVLSPEPVKETDNEPVVQRVDEPVVEPIFEPVEEIVDEPVAVVEEPEAPVEEPIAVQVEASKKRERKVVVVPDGKYTVQSKEDLYDIAKKFGIDVADLKAANPGMKNRLREGMVITIPIIVNENDYILHRCEKNERVSSLLRRWKVDEVEFRRINVSVGSHVFTNQVVLIPIDPVLIQTEPFVELPEVEEEEDEPVVVEETEIQEFEDRFGESGDCVAALENASRRYKVALMVPLYLNEVDGLEISKNNALKAQKSRPMSFLQYYEGFMLAVEALEADGLNLDLTVMDVTDNVMTAERALSKIRGKDLDLIVGPFFGKSFALVEEYAKAHDIVVVNPLSTRESVVEGNPNVVKLKPGEIGQIHTISNLVKHRYSESNVFIVSREGSADSAFLNQLQHHLDLALNHEVTVEGDELLQFARHESDLLEMGTHLVSTVEVEGQVYSVDDFRNGVKDSLVLSNSIKRFTFNEIDKVISNLSGVRNNLIVAFGDDNVFATQVLNALAKETERYPITLVAAPHWSKYEKLLVDNLLKMNTIYLDDGFVDYKSDAVKRFVRRFRKKYAAEPQTYAFEGYDMATFFLSALRRYGDGMLDCLNCCDVPLLHTQYRFFNRNYLKQGRSNGRENQYWSVYQYDNELIQLKPIDPFKMKVE